MSNVTFIINNRAKEVKRDNAGNITGLHRVNWTDNVYLPLDNIFTDVIPDTARMDVASPAQKLCSFAISLPRIPYRTIGGIALAGHNFSTSAMLRFSIFNEPAIGYSATNNSIFSNGTSLNMVIDNPKANLAIGNKVTFFGISSGRTDKRVGAWMSGAVTSYTYDAIADKGTVIFTIEDSHSDVANTVYSKWLVANSTTTPVKLLNNATWTSAWPRVHNPESPDLNWYSRNFWEGTIEDEQREEFTHLSLNFFERIEGDGLQPQGTHVHIDIDDTYTTQIYSDGTVNPSYEPFVEIGYILFGTAWTSRFNPEHGKIEFGHVDPSEFDETDTGQEYHREKQKRRTVSIGFSLLDKNEAFGKVYEMQRSQGISRPVAFAMSKEKLDEFHYAQSFIMRLSQLNPIGTQYAGIYDATIVGKEMF